MYFYDNKFPGLELVLQTDTYDYEWEAFSVFKESETGYYYWIAESGCSCTGPLEDVYVKSDLTRGTKQELINAFRSWIDDEPYCMPGDERVAYLEQISRIP